MDLTSILEEIKALRAEVAALTLSHPHVVCDVPKCKGVTGKGTVCRNGAVPGTDYCRMHDEKVDRPERPKKVKKVIKPKKIQPEHTHALGEMPIDICPLCETHGNVLDPLLTECGFVGDVVI